MTDVIIRRATVDDVSDIQRIARVGWTVTYEFLPMEVIDRVMDEWYDTEYLRQIVTDERVAYFVANEIGETDDDVIGYASGGLSEDRGGVLSLYVHPDRWGGGIGTQLFETVLEVLRERDAERVEVHVLSENSVGISFYESQGFERVREGTTEFGGTTHREYVYEEEL